jgi:DNA-binding MarR family transcriptional regulator
MSNQKRRVFDELVSEVRREGAANDRFDQAVADAVGLNRTDLRCVDVLVLEGPVTAGRLADSTGLTTGAMTTALDRLERAGLVQRTRDTVDRRRVLVRATPQAVLMVKQVHEAHIAHYQALYHRYTQEQLELLLEFTRGVREMGEREATLFEQRTLDRGPQWARTGGDGTPPPGERARRTLERATRSTDERHAR